MVISAGEKESTILLTLVVAAAAINGVMANSRTVVRKQRKKLRVNGCMASLSLWTRLLSIVVLHSLADFFEKRAWQAFKDSKG